MNLTRRNTPQFRRFQIHPLSQLLALLRQHASLLLLQHRVMDILLQAGCDLLSWQNQLVDSYPVQHQETMLFFLQCDGTFSRNPWI